MDELAEDVPIMYSNEKLKILLEESNLSTTEIFKSYVRGLNYEKVKDFPSGTSWFNTTEPLSFQKHLKGKLVLLDFFTYCCINCMHILPDLKEIEHQFSVEDGLVVIGVHSAKFLNESDSENVKNAVLRYNIEHPVVNDKDTKMWKQCGIQCWPSLLLISPEGQPLVLLMGEGHKNSLLLYIKHFLEIFSEKISRKPLPITKSSDAIRHSENLLFPGKIARFNEKLCISDSGNNRIIIVDRYRDAANREVAIVGSPCGEAGFRDGGLSSATFNQPQGVAFLGEDVIFVADTENHAVRRIDVDSGTVSTVAGNGSQSYDKNGGRIGAQQGISSPWDVQVFKTDDGKDVLLIAMAGTHQIWAVFLEDAKWWKGKEYKAGMVVCVAGSGREENRNNNYPNNAAFAQPSGLAVDQQERAVYIADSESSSVRKLSLIDGKVSAVIGGNKDPNNLFAFGDKDGVGFDAKLQHCLGLSMGATPKTSTKLFVADTYNHKIKVVDTKTNTVKTLYPHKFNEPCGLVHTQDGKLYVADTNNHQIKIVTLNDDDEVVKVETLKLDNIELHAVADAIDTFSASNVYTFIKNVSLNGQRDKTTFNFNISLHTLQFTRGAPHSWSAGVTTKKNEAITGIKVHPESGKGQDTMEMFSFDLIYDANIGKIVENGCLLAVHLQVYACEGDLCFNKKFSFRIPLAIGDFSKNMTGNDQGGDISLNIVIGKDNIQVNDYLP